jgi:hypothetical protein
MPRTPNASPELTSDRIALVESLELFVEGMLGSHPPGPEPIFLTLPVVPDAAVAAELRRRYLSAGWPRVTVGRLPNGGDPFIQLERTFDVLLGETA